MINVLIIDGNKKDRDFYKVHLEKSEQKFNIIEAVNHSDAKNLLEIYDIDCILMDYILSDHGGINLIKKIHADNKYTFLPVIVLTRNGNERIAADVIKSGASDYLIKDSFEYDKLESVVINAIKKSVIYKKLDREKIDQEEFLAIVSHDLKNPISFILTALEHIMTSNGDIASESNLKLMEKSISNAKMAMELIRNLLDKARIEGEIKLDMKIFSISELINDCINHLSFKFEENNIDVHTMFDDTIYIRADYGRIAQIINNILTNAIKFSPKNGKITIMLSSESDNSVETGDKMAKISISDTGKGIPEDMKDVIFDEFKQANIEDRKSGSGLGLNICKRICDLHKGNIWVDSKIGKGSTFHITLPKIVENEIATNAIAAVVEDIMTTVAKILIVDGSTNGTHVLTKFVKNLDYSVIKAKNTKEGLQKTMENKPDIIIIDHKIPIADGKKMLEELKTNHTTKNIPVIIYSNYEVDNHINELADWADDIMQKPTDKFEIDKHIREILKNNIVLSEKQTILVVDDDTYIRELLEQKLKDENHNVLTAKNGMEGVFWAKKIRPDILITDIRMPVMDGLELIKKVKKLYPDIKILIISAYFNKSLSMIADKYEVDGIFTKPFSLNDITQEVLKLTTMPTVASKSIPKRVIVADDSKEYQFLLKTFIEEIKLGQKIKIDGCSSGIEVLEAVEKNCIDLIVMDVNMPGMNGFETRCQLKKMGHTIPMVMFSAQSREEIEKKLLEYNVEDFIQKPLNKNLFKKKIKKYLQK
ncbi:MAG: response regulator [Bacteriovoracaceae bacterium]|nr:response regulator [Bacteriovoracaceae bacterium]